MTKMTCSGQAPAFGRGNCLQNPHGDSGRSSGAQVSAADDKHLTAAKQKAAFLALVVLLTATTALPAQDEPRPHMLAARAALIAFAQQDVEGFASAREPWRFSFPADHGLHAEHRTETWRFSGSLSSHGIDPDMRFSPAARRSCRLRPRANGTSPSWVRRLR
jgi:hypothetical protein